MKLRTRRLSAALLAFALFGAACSSNDSTEASGTSPIAELLGEDVFGFGFDPDDPAAQARLNEQQQQQEEAVAACMSEQGFEYIPVDQSSFNFADLNDGLDYSSREYAEKYGFGMTTQHMPQETVGPDLVGYDQSAFEGIEDNDPNSEIVEAMDLATQEAYYEALYGEEPEFDESFDPETATEEELDEAFSYEPQGCIGVAFGADNTNSFFEDFQDELSEMYEAIEDDPRIVEVQQKINNCISDKGYTFDTSGDGYQKLFETFQERLEQVEAEQSGSPFDEMTEEDFAAMSEDEIDAMIDFTPELSDTGKAILGELQAEETAIAVAVWDCGGSFDDSEMAETYQEVSVEYEQRFIDQNAERLEEYQS